MVVGSVIIGIGMLASHAVDASASWRCSQLQDQANDFELFALSDSERAMCDSVGVSINLQIDPEMVAARETEIAMLESAEPRFETGDGSEPPTWYKAQQYAREKDLAYMNLAPKLKVICACESAGRPDAVPQQYERDGVTVLTGKVTPEDTGMCQINTRFWGAEARRLGLDLNDPHDNVEMANYIYRQYGARPWYPSKACHGYE